MDLYQSGTYQILKNKSKFYELFTSFLRAFYELFILRTNHKFL